MSLQTKYATEIFETINDLGDESQKKTKELKQFIDLTILQVLL